MRVQHNIMAMNSYRNYNNNVSSLSANLEKLSSGYRINRAGDDAAGLAISEKMRAQITGLDAAQKNVKDGISLVKTAEGALQEVQDMMNRMVYLATQSANGTYDDAIDRDNLQKEVDSLMAEIDRIADSANFNGQKLLDGSLDPTAEAVKVSVTGTVNGENIGSAGIDLSTATFKTGDFVQLDGKTYTYDAAATDADALKFSSYDDLVTKAAANEVTLGNETVGGTQSTSDLTPTISNAALTAAGNKTPATATWAAGDSITVDGTKYSYDGTKFDDGGNSATYSDLQTALAASDITLNADGTATKEQTFSGVSYNVTDGGTQKTTGVALSTATPADGDTIAINDGTTTTTYTYKATGLGDGGADSGWTTDTTTVAAASIADIMSTHNITESAADTYTAEVDVATTVTNAELAAQPTAATATWANGDSISVTNGEGTTYTYTHDGTKFVDGDGKEFADYAAVQDDLASKNITLADDGTATETETTGGTVVSTATVPGEAMTLQIGDTSDSYNQLQVSVSDMHAEALGIANVSVATLEDAQDAINIIKTAINKVSSQRGDLGAIQNRLEHTANNLSVMEENIQDAESTIRDTDIADEMMAYTKNNILIQTSQAMLAQANMVPQGVLQLLQ